MALGDLVLDIQHVGSTALQSILAKPIIDIGIAVRNFDAAVVCVEPMQRLGYEYRGEAGIAKRHYFVKGRPRTHHVHMVEIDSEEWRSLVLFRDYLLDHPLVATQYEALKRTLAARYATERTVWSGPRLCPRRTCASSGI